MKPLGIIAIVGTIAGAGILTGIMIKKFNTPALQSVDYLTQKIQYRNKGQLRENTLAKGAVIVVNDGKYSIYGIYLPNGMLTGVEVKRTKDGMVIDSMQTYRADQ